MARKDPKAPLTTKQLKLVKAKVEAEVSNIPQYVVAQEFYPNQTPAAAAVSMSRELKSANIQEVLADALAANGISVNSVVKVVAKGMKARKTVGEAIPIYDLDEEGKTVVVGYKHKMADDHSIRLKAAGMAAQFMGIGKETVAAGGVHFHQHIETKKADYDF